MKERYYAIGVVVMMLFCSAINALAQASGSGGWGRGSTYNRLFDPKTVETVTGTVLSVDRITPSKGMSAGVHLHLMTQKDTLSIHLGPDWYLNRQDVKIAEKDRIDVTGSRITYGGKPALIASEIRRGNETLTLRDADGFPLWSAWRRK